MVDEHHASPGRRSERPLTAVAGAITVNRLADGLRVDYDGVGFIGGLPAVINTFRVATTSSGNVFFDAAFGLPIALAPGAALQFPGISPGGPVAIAPAVPPPPWGPGTIYVSATPFDAIGAFGPEGGNLLPGATLLAFVATPAGYGLGVF